MGKQKLSGRRGERERFWRRVVAGQPRSGMSVLTWCGQQGVLVSSFYAWRRELTKRDAQRQSTSAPLLPVEIVASAADASASAVEIDLPSRAKVRVRPGCERELLRQVLTLLVQVEQEAAGC